MKRFLAIATVLALTISPVSAYAAHLAGLKGQVLVNRGNGYEPATDGMELKPGDSVIANPGGEAQIVYDDGAVTGVQPGNVAYVAENTGAAGLAGSSSLAGTGTLLVGALATVGVVGVIVGVSNGNDKPASP